MFGKRENYLKTILEQILSNKLQQYLLRTKLYTEISVQKKTWKLHVVYEMLLLYIMVLWFCLSLLIYWMEF